MNQAIKSLFWSLGFTFFISYTINNQSSLANSNKLIPSDIIDNHKIAQDIPATEDGKAFAKIVDRATKANLTSAPMGKIVQQVAQEFLGAKYQAGLLDKSPQETLIISLKQFDCLLLIETVLAIANNIAIQDNSYQTFTTGIENRRYWNGTMNGYCSRLHYFSDWLKDNQRRGNLTNITRNLGGIYTPKKLDFMTTHRSSYPTLVASEANYQCIAAVENSLEGEALNYIPTYKIKGVYQQLQPGDIIGVATNIPGLDVTHTGFVYRFENGKVGLLHASPAGKVVIAHDLQTYISKVDRAIGIIVARASKN